jgi:hypothetical protein
MTVLSIVSTDCSQRDDADIIGNWNEGTMPTERVALSSESSFQVDGDVEEPEDGPTEEQDEADDDEVEDRTGDDYSVSLVGWLST